MPISTLPCQCSSGPHHCLLFQRPLLSYQACGPAPRPRVSVVRISFHTEQLLLGFACSCTTRRETKIKNHSHRHLISRSNCCQSYEQQIKATGRLKRAQRGQMGKAHQSRGPGNPVQSSRSVIESGSVGSQGHTIREVGSD